LILLTDAKTPLENPTSLATALASASIRLSLLSLAPLPSDHPIRQIITQTQGQLLTQADPHQWTTSLRQLLQSISPNRLISNPLTVTFTNQLSTLPPQSIPTAIRTWPKPNITLLAFSTEPNPTPLAALWTLGQGKVLSTAFHPAPQTIDAFASLIATPPRDP